MSEEKSEARIRLEERLAALDGKMPSHLEFGNEISVSRLETPSIGLTRALNGGWGMGRQVLIYGPKAAGKSTICLQQVAIAQREGLTCSWFDVEGAFDPEWAKRLGVDTDALIVSHHKSVNGFVDTAAALARAGIDLIVVDSITALLPGNWVDSEKVKQFADTGGVGPLARGLSQGLAMVNFENKNTLLMLISQTRKQSAGPYMFKDGWTGGQSVGFYSSQVVNLFSSTSDSFTITDDVAMGNKLVEVPVGRKVKYRVIHNKLGSEGLDGEYDLFFLGDRVGIDNYGEVLEAAVMNGIVTRAGAWYAYDGNNIGQGRDNTLKRLKSDDDLFQSIKNDIQEASG